MPGVRRRRSRRRRTRRRPSRRTAGRGAPAGRGRHGAPSPAAACGGGAAADGHLAGGGGDRTDEGREQGGLAGAIAAHEGDGFAGGHGEADAVQGLYAAAADGEVTDLGRARAGGLRGGGARPAAAEQPREEPGGSGTGRSGNGGSTPGPTRLKRRRGRELRPCRRPRPGSGQSPGSGGGGQAGQERSGPAAGVADRQGERGPAREAAQGDHRRMDRGDGHDLRRGADDRGRARRRQQQDPVGVLDDPLQPVLRHEHGRAQVVDQPLEDREDLLGRRRVQRGRRLVQHQHLRVRGQHRADRHPLLLAAGQRRDRPVAELVQPQQVQGLLHPAAHHRWWQAQRLHAVGELVLDHIRHEVRERVLAHRAHHVRELPRPVRTRVTARDRDTAAQGAAREVRDQPAHGPQQGGLPDPGRADQQRQLALRDL